MESSNTQPAGITHAATNAAYPATVIITTKNRKDELRKAIASTLTQSIAVEILVLDDGSTDGTTDLVRAEFPQARLARVEESLGVIGARNHAMRLATSPIVFTIDDDCVFPSPDIIQQTLADFDHPRIGAIAIPSLDVHTGYKAHWPLPDANATYVCSEFRGGANAMRRDLFLKLEGYHSFLFRQGEEADYGMRLLNAGYVVRVGRALPIHHYESPVRNRDRIFYYQARSNLLNTWYNVPMPYFPAHLLATIFNVTRHGFVMGSPLPVFRGVGAALAGFFHEFSERSAIRGQSYRLFRKIRATGLLPLADIEDQLASPLPL